MDESSIDPTIDESGATGGFDSSWLAARLGRAIDAGVDRLASNQAQNLNGIPTGYGIDAYGRLYPLGQPGITTAAAPARISPVLMAGLVLLLVMLVND